MPFLLRAVAGPFIMRDGIAADDPMLEISNTAWTPFLVLNQAYRGPDGELGNSELVVREITDDQYEMAIDEANDGRSIVVEGKPVRRPVARPRRRPPPPAAAPAATEEPSERPATMAATVPAEQLARHLGGEAPTGDAFETDTDESATEPHDRPQVGKRDDAPPAVAQEASGEPEEPSETETKSRKGKRGRK